MDDKRLCMGCMAEKGDADPCPECGWAEGTMPDSPAQLTPRTVLAEKYLLGRVLGQGGFGITYLAWDLLLSRKLAIKEYYPREICSRGRDALTVQSLNPRGRQDFQYGLAKFVEEGQNLARFRDYPGIVSLLEFFEANGTAYIVMAYMEGMTLKQYLEEQGNKISFETTLAILTPVMDALREVHRVGMLHRDISPDNIYINQDRQVKILDFGATRYAMREQSHGLTVLFKPGYAPLEQYSSGGKQGTWTDVYAVGATFYRCLTGKAPSEAPDRMAQDDLILPIAMGITIPIKSEPALLKALAVRWENRFQRIQDFQEAITPIDEEPRPAQDHSKRIWMIAACALFASTLAFAALWLSGKSTKPTTTPVASADSNYERDNKQLREELNQTKKMLDAANNNAQQLKDKLEASTKAPAAVTAGPAKVPPDIAKTTDHTSTPTPTPPPVMPTPAPRPPPKVPTVPRGLSVAYLQFYEWDRLTNTRKGPANQFQASSTRRVLCAVGGPNPTQSGEGYSGQITFAVYGPGGKTTFSLAVRTNSTQPTWASMAYWGADQAGTLRKGAWHVEVSSGERILKRGAFNLY
jgi:serine/threonine protein kinase